jgi:hypothetical protein
VDTGDPDDPLALEVLSEPPPGPLELRIGHDLAGFAPGTLDIFRSSRRPNIEGYLEPLQKASNLGGGEIAVV